MFCILSLAALQLCISCALYDISFHRLVTALVLLWLDYNNAALAGLKTCLLSHSFSKLQLGRLSFSVSLTIHWCSCQFSLTTSTWACQVEAEGHCLPSMDEDRLECQISSGNAMYVCVVCRTHRHSLVSRQWTFRKKRNNSKPQECFVSLLKLAERQENLLQWFNRHIHMTTDKDRNRGSWC